MDSSAGHARPGLFVGETRMLVVVSPSLTKASIGKKNCPDAVTSLILWRPRRDLNPCYRHERTRMATRSGFSKGGKGFVDHKWIKTSAVESLTVSVQSVAKMWLPSTTE